MRSARCITPLYDPCRGIKKDMPWMVLRQYFHLFVDGPMAFSGTQRPFSHIKMPTKRYPTADEITSPVPCNISTMLHILLFVPAVIAPYSRFPPLNFNPMQPSFRTAQSHPSPPRRYS